ncbi:MAG TPA: arylesterase [Moraxellaceae bacterium]|nr:arylesterase [Moraxellaceae bacterium]
MSLHFGRGGQKVARALLVLLAPLAAGAAQAATILVFGDSISAAYGLEPAQGWVVQLQQRLDKAAPGQHRVVNGSLSGETTAGGRARLPPLLVRHRPDVVVLELGGNDGLRGLPPGAMAANLRRMVGDARAAGARVVLLGIRIPPNYGRQYTQAFEQVFTSVSQEEKVPLVPFFLAGKAGGLVPLQPDGVHPTAAAQGQLLDNAWPAIEKALKAR